MKLKNILIVVLFFTTLICKSQGNTIVGAFKDSDCNENVLFLYKYNSPFSEELIDQQKGINGVFSFRRGGTEIDTYLLRDGKSKSALLFIWDDDLIIDLDCRNIHESVVRNSPQTSELNRIEKLKYNLYVVPLLKLDSLVSQCQKQNKLGDGYACQKIVSERAKVETEDKKLFNEFTMTYIKNNPDSFVSLYYLTFGGDEFMPETKDIEGLRSLSDRLKRHSRSRKYANQ